MKKLILTTILILMSSCIESPERSKYKYASDEAWDHCYDSCPGPDCPCILGGSGLTWYISAEVGE